MDKIKIKKLNLSKKFPIFLLFAIGILLIITASINNSGKSNSEYNSDYGTHLENKLKSTLESVTGKNTVDVMITFESTYELPKGGKEDKYAYVFSNNENQHSPLETPTPKIAGVMIVCKGITESEDFLNIKKAAATVLSTSEQKIYIIGGVTDNEKHS